MGPGKAAGLLSQPWSPLLEFYATVVSDTEQQLADRPVVGWRRHWYTYSNIRMFWLSQCQCYCWTANPDSRSPCWTLLGRLSVNGRQPLSICAHSQQLNITCTDAQLVYHQNVFRAVILDHLRSWRCIWSVKWSDCELALIVNSNTTCCTTLLDQNASLSCIAYRLQPTLYCARF